MGKIISLNLEWYLLAHVRGVTTIIYREEKFNSNLINLHYRLKLSLPLLDTLKSSSTTFKKSSRNIRTIFIYFMTFKTLLLVIQHFGKF